MSTKRCIAGLEAPASDGTWFQAEEPIEDIIGMLPIDFVSERVLRPSKGGEKISRKNGFGPLQDAMMDRKFAI